ncbi:MAG TPA: ankyrin repeat domain-containing protein [Pyrinomonadaceae bacterium]|nr:ankyrin repeat domain-containing protein [Pyrinomonadaceae bacterium]
MSLEADYLGAFEVHSPDGIRDALAAGASPTQLIKGKTPIHSLIEGYLRSSRFAACLQVLLDAGATIGEPLIEALLLDDDASLRRILNGESGSVNRRLSVPCAFTCCDGVTPLHICAEFNSVRCAKVLLDAGANVDAPADIDADGFGGQTPIFHAVNSIRNYCRPAMELLVEAGADLDVRLKGLVWGPRQDWETLVLDVTPISYSQCGLYSQFHRAEQDVYSNLRYLYRSRYETELRVRNVPNKYLAPRG